jgi:isopenicillin N synthase-like dioxygenase
VWEPPNEEGAKGGPGTGESLPVIDIGGQSSPNLSDRKQVAARLWAACRHNGFFYISNRCIDEALVGDVFFEAAAFFAQAIEVALDLKRKEIELLEIPLSPSRLFELTRKANKT